MGHTRNSIIINAPYNLVFDISNKIERWTELFGKEYVKAEILERKGNEITFRWNSRFCKKFYEEYE